MSLGAVNNHSVLNFPPELIHHTAKIVANDPSTNKKTLKACSLTFKGLTHLFQHALTSRNSDPEIIISRDYPQDMYDRKFRALLDILKANPSFAESVSRLKVTVTVSDGHEVEATVPDGSEVYPLLSLFTRLSSLSIGSVSEVQVPEYGTGPPIHENRLYWTDIPEMLRTALQSIIQSPVLQNLELRQILVPWATFFGAKVSLDRLYLRGVMVEMFGSADGTDGPDPSPSPSSLMAVRHLDACIGSALVFVANVLQLKQTPIHIGKLQRLEIHVPSADDFGTKFHDVATILHQPELKIEKLTVLTHGMCPTKEISSMTHWHWLIVIVEVWYKLETILFEPDQPCLANLKHLQLTFSVDESEDVHNGYDPFQQWAEALGQFPTDNKLQTLTFNILMCERVYPSVGEWMGPGKISVP